MASDFEKPDKIHVLTQDMVPQKLWPLPVGNLFGVGPKSVKRMHEIGIYTIGDLANADADILRGVFGVRGQVFRDYANGIESEPQRGEGQQLRQQRNHSAGPEAPRGGRCHHAGAV